MTDRMATPALAKAAGFTNAAYIDLKQLDFMPEIRQMCSDNRCGRYGKGWMCPPACGTLDEVREKLLGYDYGLLLQVTGQLEDDFDVEAMEKAERDCNAALDLFAAGLRPTCKRVLPANAGGCRRCKVCTYPDAPCRFPELASPSLEAYGLFVSRECEHCGIPYYYGPRTITFVAAIFISEKD